MVSQKNYLMCDLGRLQCCVNSENSGQETKNPRPNRKLSSGGAGVDSTASVVSQSYPLIDSRVFTGADPRERPIGANTETDRAPPESRVRFLSNPVMIINIRSI